MLAGLDDELEIGKEADDLYHARDQEVHGSDAYLDRAVDRLRTSRYVSLLKDAHPYPCALIEHYEWVKANLFDLA